MFNKGLLILSTVLLSRRFIHCRMIPEYYDPTIANPSIINNPYIEREPYINDYQIIKQPEHNAHYIYNPSLDICVDSDYKEIRALGRGDDGFVFLLERKRDKKKFARKVAVQTPMAQQFLKKEISLLTKLKGKGVTSDIKCIGSDGFSFITEFVSGVTLDQLDASSLPGSTVEAKVHFLASKMMDAYLLLHQMDIVHSDGHLRNWIYDAKSKSMRLIDFGRAMDLQRETYQCQPHCKKRDVETAGKLWAVLNYNFKYHVKDGFNTWLYGSQHQIYSELSKKMVNIISLMWPNPTVEFFQIKQMLPLLK